ncbi:MAG: amino acid adenylation domain-containing protein [Verrucomicrobia bacterium]|nr:amino acid adenylation domain-containing protein [Verrucomicrobiota bacterium]
METLQTSARSPLAAPAREFFRFPATSAQQRIWFLEEFHPGSPLHNVPVAVKIAGMLEVPAFERAINQVVQRHEILRTSFGRRRDALAQMVAPALAVPLPVRDLRGLPAAEREAHALRIACDHARQPFDLGRLPLLRAQLLKLSDAEHIFVLTVHHMIFDGWSLNVFFRDIGVYYGGRQGDQPLELSALPIQYADFAVWQRAQLASGGGSLEWWRRQLGGGPPPLELPTDRPRPAVSSYRGAVETLELPPRLHSKLAALSRRERATMFMTLLAAWQTLLHRYTGREAIAVGTPVAGRSLPETETLIGLFINTLVLRGDLSGNPTFRALLARVRETVLDALAHDDVPFDKLVEALHPERSVSHAPLVQVMFALEHAPLEAVPWPGLRLTQLELDSGTAKFDLTLYLVERAAGLTARLEYSTDIFDAATIRHLLGHYHVLLEGIAAEPERPLAALPLLTEIERHKLLVEWNDTRADYPRQQTVADLFAAQAACRPQTIAVIDHRRWTTYRELDGHANQLARFLRRNGVGRGTLVGICVDRSVAMLVGLLGILKAGGAYVPLDPAFPRERLAWMMEDSQAPVIVTEKPRLETLPPTQARCIRLDEQWPEIVRESCEPLPAGAGPGDLAYVLYTSGSTGKPKGVAIPHRAVVNFLHSMQLRPGLTSADRLLAVTTLSFDIAALELFLPLAVGGCVVLATREEAADATRLAEKISASGATVMQATPATWRMLLDSGWTGAKSLRIFCGGEALPRALADRLLTHGAELWNLYGPTETTIWSSVAKVEAGARPVVIGRPIANTQLHVLDAHLQLVPVGAPGELFIGGDGLARGYVNRPELTAERFLPDPFSTVPGARLYRTGDLARRRPDGEIELLGRADHQVKLRGFRIELGEIETVLRELPAVSDAVVVAREDAPGDKRLVAYFIAAATPAPGAAELRELLGKKLPDYMVPSAFVPLERLPLTPNGKIDRRALPAPALDRMRIETSFVAPQAGVEQTIAAVWEEVLSVKRPGANDNFFDLGGHSLNVVQVQGRLRERLGREVPLLGFFQHPTIRSLARALDGHENGSGHGFHERIRARAQQQRGAAARPRGMAAASRT